MLTSTIISFLTIPILALNSLETSSVPMQTLLSEHQISLNQRQPDKYVNQVFKENILLNLYALRYGQTQRANFNWEEVLKPFEYDLVLEPGETFSYHDIRLSQYQSRATKTTNAHFNFTEGFKSDGFLVGDGVCHLASLMYWVSLDGNLEALAPTNHNFAQIPQVPREYGVSIYALPQDPYTSGLQNLYITNNFSKKVLFKFNYNGDVLDLKLFQLE